MKIAIITGSGGLAGSEAVEFFYKKFDKIIGIDNNMRAKFFGKEGSVAWNIKRLKNKIPNYLHHHTDIRNFKKIKQIFNQYSSDIKLILHAAAQPSHDYAAKETILDFTINANGTLNLLELVKQYCSKAVYIYISTNKVYGDNPNKLPLTEQETRWEVAKNHRYYKNGIDETMSLDNTVHSFMGVSKLAGDIACQEYAKYFGLKTGIFRCGCLTGPKHSGAQLHGFLSYLVKCAITDTPYTIFGYKGKQVRDNLHSKDLINMFWHFYKNPRAGQIYNAGGGRYSNCSVLEAIRLIEKISGRKMKYSLRKHNRIGDHMWWISNAAKFIADYPNWKQKYSLEDTLVEIFESLGKKYS